MKNLAPKYLLNSKKLIQVSQMMNYMVKMENNQMKYIKRQFDKAPKEVYDKSLNQKTGIFGKIRESINPIEIYDKDSTKLI